MKTLFITGTGTEVGKTIVTAAIASLAHNVAVLKAAQTGVVDGEAGDVATVARLSGAATAELARYAEPLAPATAARRAGAHGVPPQAVAAAAAELAAEHAVVLVEGAGGLLVRYDDNGGTIADAAAALSAPVLLVAHAGLGTLNTAALTAEALSARGLRCAGVVIGSWPASPDLAARCNVADLPEVTGVPLLGAVPEGAGELAPAEFRAVARRCLAPELGGRFDPAEFARGLLGD